MGTVKSRNIINEEGKINRIREVSACCLGIKADDKGHITHKWPFFCQWWNGSVRKKCVPCMFYSREDTENPEKDSALITPISYFSRKNGNGVFCALYSINYCWNNNGKKKEEYNASFPFFYKDSNGCGTLLGYCGKGCYISPVVIAINNKTICGQNVD